MYDGIEHPSIFEAECFDMRRTEQSCICPVCLQECDTVYYRSDDITRVLGCENCVDRMDAEDYKYKTEN